MPMTYPEHEAQPMLIHEPTFTQVPNELLDTMDRLLPCEFKVAMLICRQTFGWHKESDVISLTQMEAKTGLARNTIIKAVEGLEKRHLIKKAKTDAGNAYQLVVQKMNPPSAKNELASAKNEPGGSAKFEHTKERVLTINKQRRTVSVSSGGLDSGNGFHQAFIKGWCENYETVWGFKYQFDKGKDSSAVKGLMAKNIPITDLIETAKRAWTLYQNDPKAWNCGQATTIHGFNWKLMAIMADLTTAKTPVRTTSVYELKTVRETKQKMADELKYRYCFEGPLGNQWDNDIASGDYAALKKEIRDLDHRISASVCPPTL